MDVQNVFAREHEKI